MPDATTNLPQFYVRHVWPAAKFELRQFISVATVASTLLGTIACHVMDHAWGQESAFFDAVPTLLGLAIASVCYVVLKAAIIAPTKVAMRYHGEARAFRQRTDELAAVFADADRFEAALKMFDSVQEALIAWSRAIRAAAPKAPTDRWPRPSIQEIKYALDDCMKGRREQYPEIFGELWPTASRPWSRIPDDELVDAMSFFRENVQRARERFILSRERVGLLVDTPRN